MGAHTQMVHAPLRYLATDPSSSSSFTWPAGVALAAALVGVLIALYQAKQARRAFLGQNFLTLMEKLQAKDARDNRGILKDHLRPPDGEGELLRWEGAQSSRVAKLAVDVSQLFDQVGILVRKNMVDRSAILDNWSPTILEMYIVCLPVIHGRQATNPYLWRSFQQLAAEASNSSYISDELANAYRAGASGNRSHAELSRLIRDSPELFLLRRLDAAQ
jgi:hypothetical protein